MNKKYNIIINFVLALVLLIIAIIFQINESSTSSFIVSIFISISTGILVGDIPLIIENYVKVKELTNEFERVTCKILKNIYNIINIDLDNEYVELVRKQRVKILNNFQLIDNLIEQFNMHLVFKEKRIKKILSILFNLRDFMITECHFPNDETKQNLQDYKTFIKFECLKIVKYCKQFNPQPIFTLLYSSKNNILNTFEDIDNTLYGIIFSEDLREFNKEADQNLTNEIFLEFEEKYINFDINHTKDIVKSIKHKDWSWGTYISKKYKKIISIKEDMEEE